MAADGVHILCGCEKLFQCVFTQWQLKYFCTNVINNSHLENLKLFCSQCYNTMNRQKQYLFICSAFRVVLLTNNRTCQAFYQIFLQKAQVFCRLAIYLTSYFPLQNIPKPVPIPNKFKTFWFTKTAENICMLNHCS